MNDKLLREFTKEEISAALHQMSPQKALSPDGFSAGFFQENLDIVGDEVCLTVLAILNSGTIASELNFTYIALIPKTKNALWVSEFRPISLCNVFYKIISKVLANVEGDFATPDFSKSKCLHSGAFDTNNIQATYETLHTMHSRMWGKDGYMAIKLDMSKAYDRVKWRCLEAVMRRMSFTEKWINLIMMCISTANYTVLVNGNPVRHIYSSRGLG